MLIGVVGFIGQGKGTVGEHLEKLGFQKLAFANPLKDAVSIIFGWDRQLLEGDTIESRAWREIEDPYWSAKLGKKITPRLVLQWMGTEAGRKIFGENLWTASIQKQVDPKQNYVITDVRFVNEIEAIKELGGFVVRVRRGPNPDWIPFAQVAKAKGWEVIPEFPNVHISEWDWINSRMDYVLDNDGSKEDLFYKVNYMVELLKNTFRL